MSEAFHRMVDPRPLRLRVVSALGEFPDGATSAELAAVMGDAQYSISSIVSKIFSYGGPIEKVGKMGPSVRWRLRQTA